MIRKTSFPVGRKRGFFLLYVESNQYMKPIHVLPISHDLSATELHPKFQFIKLIHVLLTTHNLLGYRTTLKISIYQSYTRSSDNPQPIGLRNYTQNFNLSSLYTYFRSTGRFYSPTKYHKPPYYSTAFTFSAISASFSVSCVPGVHLICASSSSYLGIT